MKRLAWMIGCFATIALAWAQTPAPSKPAAKPAAAQPEAEPRIPYPDWLFPVDDDTLRAAKRPPAKQPKEPPKYDDVEQLTIPDSDQKFTLARINDPFNAPDWFPAAHGPMPDIVARGHKPKIIACAYCHTPTGQGRPENAALAGLPEAYIKEQLEAFRSGERRSIGPEVYVPSHMMQPLAATLSDEEIDESAKYFAQQKLARRHYVVEGINIPRAEPAFWVYKEVDGTEDLGERLVEVAPDITRHERRDPKMQYTAYAPPGSLVKGKSLATTGDKGKTQICSTCHLARLEGTDKIPPIAGRSPTYLLRQLIAFKNGTRTNEAAKQMDAVVEKLELADMVALAAYVGSLYPPR
ncbi:MAG TPA: c-type cytochrome [Steroidobacteraceae bacterium]|nr:c-type cytochrome [Steroidobacteraceae bacterium]